MFLSDLGNMELTYIQESNKPEVSEQEILEAVRERYMQAVKDGISRRSGADLRGMHYSALFYRLKKYKAMILVIT